jgi:MFS family permease
LSLVNCSANTYNDIGGFAIRTWLPLVHSLAFAAVAPFAGHVSDLVGRRYIALGATTLIIIGMVVFGTAHAMDVAIIGMAIAGMGGGIGGTVGVAGILEIVPVKMRGRYLGTVFLHFLPMGPSVAYGIPL